MRATRVRRSAALPMPWIRSPSPMLSPICWRGSSDAYGSWKMICIRRRTDFSLLPPTFVMSCPVERDRAAGRIDEAEQHAADRRLAAARLPDEAERLAPPDREAHVVDGLHVTDLAMKHAALEREELREVRDLDERRLRRLRLRHLDPGIGRHRLAVDGLRGDRLGRHRPASAADRALSGTSSGVPSAAWYIQQRTSWPSATGRSSGWDSLASSTS